MEIGFRLFAGLAAAADVYEVFPSAAYAQLVEADGSVLSIDLRGFAHGPKDMLDAYVAAYTVHEYLAGRGSAIGGGDSLGEIILPKAHSCQVDCRPHVANRWSGAADQPGAAGRTAEGRPRPLTDP
jgi:predicted nuclease with RNAse H fold